MGLWSSEITTLLTIQAQWHYVILFSLTVFAHGRVRTWLWYVSAVLVVGGRGVGSRVHEQFCPSDCLRFWMRVNSSFHMALCEAHMSPLNVLILCRRHNGSLSNSVSA